MAWPTLHLLIFPYALLITSVPRQKFYLTGNIILRELSVKDCTFQHVCIGHGSRRPHFQLHTAELEMPFEQTKHQALHQVSFFQLIVFILLCRELLCIEQNNYCNRWPAAQIMKGEV